MEYGGTVGGRREAFIHSRAWGGSAGHHSQPPPLSHSSVSPSSPLPLSCIPARPTLPRRTRLTPPRADPPATSRNPASLEEAVRAAAKAAEAGHAAVDEAAASAARKAEDAAGGLFGRRAGNNNATVSRGVAPVTGRPPRSPAASRARGVVKIGLALAALYCATAFGAAVLRVVRASNTPTAVRARTVDKNRAVVEALAAAFRAESGGGGGGGDGATAAAPSATAGLTTAGLTPALVRKLASRTGFTPTEVFRKWLWYALRERRFDERAVSDIVALKGAAGLSDADVAGALAERAARIYARYGDVMLSPVGMTQAGIERKATARALFSKLLYLAECEALLDPASEAGRALDIPSAFGATDEDAAKLRLVSLLEVDLDKLDAQFGAEGGGSGWGGLAA